jgi:glycine oxidase
MDETDVDIELDREGTLYLAFNENDVREIRHRFDWQKAAGLQIEHLSAQETRQIEPFVSPDVLESLFFPNDWQVENRKLLHALQKYCELNEIKIAEYSRACQLIIENDKAVGVKTPLFDLFAEKIVHTNGAWTALLRNQIFEIPEIKPIRGQMISFQTAKRLFSKVIYSPRGYIVPRRDGRILVGATAEDVGFDKNITDAGIEFLMGNAFEISPSLANLEIHEKWCGLRPFAPDGLPILGSFPQVGNFFVATGHYRNGILLAPLTAKILADKIAENQDSEYLRVFSPNRFASNGLRSLQTTV